MPTFPGFTATTAPPRSSGLARATNIGALTRTSEQARFSGLGAFGRGLQQVGGIAFQAAQNRQAIDDTIEWGTATSRVKDRFRLAEDAAERMDVSLDMPLPDDPDYLKTLQSFSTDARDKFLTEALKDIEGDVNKINTGFKSEKNKAQFNNWYNDNYGNMANRVRSMYDKKLDSYQRSEMDKLRETAAGNGDVETADKFTELMDKYELITPERAEALKKNNKAIAAFEAVENIKPVLIDAIALSNKPEDGYEALNAATSQLVKDGILTEPEAAETNKKLGDWIDSYVSGRIKATKEADKLTTIQSYQELSKPILDGKLTYDDIDNSDLRETRRSGEQISDADRWRKYIKGSYKEAPTKNSSEGHTVSFAAVYDAATLQLSPKEAYDVLLESRFVDQSITNEQFEWAVDKIENPYPKHVLEDLKATLKSNLEDFNRLFSSDKERNKKVNEALISWVDAQDKPPSKKEMFAMSSAFRAGSGQPYDIGRVIERGGREWEIIGFDDNGEPLVEEVGGYGPRNDGITQKGTGFLGELQIRGGGVATEYSVGVKLEAYGGKETDIPSLVPTLTKEEINLMVNDIIPNNKPIPPKILQKAVDYANKRVRQGKSVFFVGGD